MGNAIDRVTWIVSDFDTYTTYTHTHTHTNALFFEKMDYYVQDQQVHCIIVLSLSLLFCNFRLLKYYQYI